MSLLTADWARRMRCLGGGRYDGLSEILGGPKAPGIGFAIGEDRLILTLQAMREQKAELADALYCSFVGGSECRGA